MPISFPPYVLRRAKFLISEAKSPDPKYDQTVRIAMRVISNFATVGRDGDSRRVKLLNKLVSQKAKLLRAELTDDQWHKATTNEHPEELRLVWAWLREKAGELSPIDVCNRLAEHPFITITNDEAKDLRKVKAYASPLERYALVGVEITSIEDD